MLQARISNMIKGKYPSNEIYCEIYARIYELTQDDISYQRDIQYDICKDMQTQG